MCTLGYSQINIIYQKNESVNKYRSRIQFPCITYNMSKQSYNTQTPHIVHAYPVPAGGGGAPPVQGYVFTGQGLQQQPQYQQQPYMQQQQMQQQYMMQQQQPQQQFMQVPHFALPDASSYLNAPGGREFLAANGWPEGLQHTLIASAAKIPLRYFICDNSGSMATSDGKRVVGSGNQTKIVGCTRWSELTDSLRFHAMLSEKLGVISDFRLLNGSMPLRLGPHDLVGDNLATLFHEFDKGPNGGTPLCMHIAQIVREVTQIKGQLMANNQKVCVVIATDGESSDGNVVQAMKALERLPVMVVIRLCTDDEKIVQYWNSVDSQVEVEIDVLDDLTGEAEEVNEKNPWLNYGLPMVSERVSQCVSESVREWVLYLSFYLSIYVIITIVLSLFIVYCD